VTLYPVLTFLTKKYLRTPLEIKPNTFEFITLSIRLDAGSVVGIAVTLGAGRSEARMPVGVIDFSALQIVQTVLGAHPPSYSKGTGFLARG
jgi:ABC-type sugar transport system ATPase subunit